MDFKEIMELMFKEYELNGYRARFDAIQDEGMADIAEIGLFVTEVSEAIEAVRSGNNDNLVEELADIIIRVMNFAKRKDLNLEDAILDKHKKNLIRGKYHGRKV